MIDIIKCFYRIDIAVENIMYSVFSSGMSSLCNDAILEKSDETF